MAEKKNLFVMRPYHDMHSPFSVGEAGGFAEYIARDPENFPELALGMFVLIQDMDAKKGDFWFVGRVIELRSISPFNPQKESALYAEDEERNPAVVLTKVTGPHTHQPMIARVRLERCMMATDDKKFISSAVQRPPSGRSFLYFPDMQRRDGDESPALHDMLEVRDKGITLGYVGQGAQPLQKGNDFLPYKWDVDHLDNKHIFVVGESGSGKTVLLKNLAYQLRKHNPRLRIIMTDVQGDISQLLAARLDGITLTPKSKWQESVGRDETPEDAMKAFGKRIRLIVPATQRDPSSRLSSLKILAEKAGHEVREIGLRLEDLSRPSDVEYLFRTTSEQVGMLLDKIAEYCKDPLKKGVSPEPASLKALRKQVNRILRGGEDKKVSVGDTTFLSSTFGAASRALTSLESFFDFHQQSMDGDNPLNALDYDGTVIFYMDDLDYEERIMWEMQLVKWLYDKRREDWNAFVFFDEAHQIIPARPSGVGGRTAGTFDRLRVNFERLAREGRKFGINLVLGTQSPQDLHPIVPDQCQTKIVMKINPRNAREVSLDKELSGIAVRFGAGQFWIQSPFNGTPDWVRVHSAAPPLPHMTMTPYWDKMEEAAKA